MLLMAVASSAAAGLGDRVAATSISLPASLEGSISSWGTWGGTSIGPRLYLVPRSDGSLLLGWTDSSGTGRISRLSGASATAVDSFTGHKLKGLVAHDDGSYAVLRWNSPAETMRLAKYNPGGTQHCATIVDTVQHRVR